MISLVRKKEKPVQTGKEQEEPYNYPHFRPHYYDLQEFAGPHAGDVAGDFMAYDLLGQKVRLSDFRGQWVVLETGSLTCPMYAQHVGMMNQLTLAFSDVAFLLLYIREAHPGKKVGAHRSMISKIRCARQLLSEYAERRQVLVDDLVGNAHRQYGGFPNMIYVIDPNGRVVYRSDWNRPKELAWVLENRSLLIQKDHNSPPMPSPWITVTTLLKGGWDAVLDVIISVPGYVKMVITTPRAR